MTDARTPAGAPTRIKITASASLLAPEFGRTAAMFAKLASNMEKAWVRAPSNYALHSGYVYGSVVLSVMFLEALINEFFTLSGEYVEPNKKMRRLASFWQLGIPRTASYPILHKYQVALSLTDTPRLAVSRQPFQDAQTLVALRNELVHNEPIYQPHEDVPAAVETYPLHRLVSRLRGKFPLNPVCAPFAPMWPIKLIGAGAAVWAVTSAVEFVQEFARRWPIKRDARYCRRITKEIRAELPEQTSLSKIAPSTKRGRRTARG